MCWNQESIDEKKINRKQKTGVYLSCGIRLMSFVYPSAFSSALTDAREICGRDVRMSRD